MLTKIFDKIDSQIQKFESLFEKHDTDINKAYIFLLKESAEALLSNSIEENNGCMVNIVRCLRKIYYVTRHRVTSQYYSNLCLENECKKIYKERDSRKFCDFKEAYATINCDDKTFKEEINLFLCVMIRMKISRIICCVHPKIKFDDMTESIEFNNFSVLYDSIIDCMNYINFYKNENAHIDPLYTKSL